ELIVVPSSPATRPCQADQPRPSSQGRRIASPHPGSGIASGLRITSRSPLAAAAPTLTPPAKPRLRPMRTSFARGASSSTTAASSPGESLSTTISSSPSRSSASRGGTVRRSSAPELQATIRTETEGRTDAEASQPAAPVPIRALPGLLLLLASARGDVETELVRLHHLAVLAFHVEDRQLRALAEVRRVLQEALLAALHVQDERLQRDVRGVVEHRLQPAVVGADDAVQLDVDLAFEVRQEVRKLVLRGDQVDRALQLLLEQRTARFRAPVDRVLRAFVRRQLDPRADGLDVTLIEEQRVRQVERRAGDVGVALARLHHDPDLRVLRPRGRAGDPRVERGLEPEFVTPGRLVGRVHRV